MDVYHCEEFSLNLPRGHRFPAAKYQQLHARLAAAGDARFNIMPAPAASAAELSYAHSVDYISRVLDGRLSAQEQRRIGFPWTPALVQRSLRSVGATLAAFRAAGDTGVAVSLAGGTHHAGHAGGAGFCVFNDIAVATLDALRNAPARHVLVVDCDVHQGDGTAAILAGVAGAYTFSLHSARNYPHAKALSDLDIALPDGLDDADYLAALEIGLAHAFAVARPAAVIYVAGADIFAGDRLGRLHVSAAGVAARDEYVLRACEAHGAALAVVMGGGYAEAIDDIVAIHQATVTAALGSWQRRATAAA